MNPSETPFGADYWLVIQVHERSLTLVAAFGQVTHTWLQVPSVGNKRGRLEPGGLRRNRLQGQLNRLRPATTPPAAMFGGETGETLFPPVEATPHQWLLTLLASCYLGWRLETLTLVSRRLLV